MAINFTKNIEEFTSIHRTTKAKQFMEFTSKKQLKDADVLTDKQYLFVSGIKGTFNFALHNDGRYMAITLYRTNAEKKYNFLVLDLDELAVAEVGSIKEAKAEILALVTETEETPASETEEVTTPAEQTPGEDEALADTVKNLLDEALNESENDKKGRKSNKTA